MGKSRLFSSVFPNFLPEEHKGDVKKDNRREEALEVRMKESQGMLP